jgi:hypothetical protein
MRTYMKKLFAIAVAACVTSTAAFAAPLSGNQGKFLIVYLMTMLVDHDCRQMDYSLKKDGLQRIQDELGVDDRTRLAVVAAAQLVSEREYNRSDLIPEVTKLVQVTLMWLSQERDEPDFCMESMSAARAKEKPRALSGAGPCCGSWPVCRPKHANGPVSKPQRHDRDLSIVPH